MNPLLKKARLLFSVAVFAVSIVAFNQTSTEARSGMDCVICVGGAGPDWCQMNPAGRNSCVVVGGACQVSGSLCACPDPTVPCEA